MKEAKKKKLLRRQRQEELRERTKFIRERLQNAEEVEVQYVLSSDSDGEKSPAGDVTSRAVAETGNVDVEDEDRVQLPSITVNEAAGSKSKKNKQQRQKMSWEALKLAVAQRYGSDVSAMVSEHDGNAEDPLFTVFLKSVRRTVPVPQHWNRLRAFMANQADREKATDLVPPEIALLGVERIRATRDKKASIDQVAFVSCFITGTPLQRKRFNVSLSRFGDVFYEGKWLPKGCHTPGVLSQRLRTGLGMGPHSPPPWLYGMQAMRRLPPAYPGLKVPGLNAPIPPGAQWGNGEGQWGQPPRTESNTFLFPGVMDEVAVEEAPPVYWGTVPPLTSSSGSHQQQKSVVSHSVQAQPTPATVSTTKTPAPVTTPPPAINPVPFHPQAYTPATAVGYVPTTPQEYVRVQDSTVGATVALGSVLVPKAAVGAATMNQQQRQQQPQQQPPAKQVVPPRAPTKF
ncbi:spliceosome-associated protein, putative [Trypanosoma brucei brucei TREU927]|uniref:Spliceosome-associated protein, putative n=1 Tax=Trypanosoma brucei brucei (strain 927/4 GUTat10.1) TaxID=185431 RepID=Q584V6_TRYB2|nr:spliceosome-associated protein, putative [Trypanosoma brucei brucei TREU927]AAX80834.1 spliceosome-associated protein, putative [Trypanosoma brucei]AAZ11762.1 spliceosome-associated protein, putative [Trypanosoma brucei brucei TREU927]